MPFTLGALLLLAGQATVARAQPPGAAAAADPWAGEQGLELPQQVELGRPARGVEIRLRSVQADSGRPERHEIVALLGRRAQSWTLPAAPTRARLRTLTLGDGTPAALVRVEIGEETRQAVFSVRAGRPQLIWRGRTSLRGDRGERHGEALRLLPGDAGGLVVGRVQERVRVCGRGPALLSAQALTSRGAEGLGSNPLDAAPPAISVRADVLDGTATPTPRLRPLLFYVSSGASVAGDSGLVSMDALAAPAPTSLTDGDESTGWRPRANRGLGEFVTARTIDPLLPIERFELSLGLPDAAGRLAQVRALWVVPETGAPLLVEIPSGAHRVRIVPPEPLRGRCLSLVLARVEGPRGAAPPALTEVRAFTNIDRPGGRAELMGALAEAGPPRDHAVRILAALGRPALLALAEAWPEMPRGERRAALAVARVRVRDLPEAIALLVRGAHSNDDGVRQAAWTGLERGLPRTAASLAALTREGGDVGWSAGTLLARQAPAEALPALLDALAREGGSEEARLRGALAQAAAGAGAEAAFRLRRWAEAEPPTPALVAAALAIAGQGGDTAQELTRLARERAEDFPERYRTTLALAKLPAEAAGDAWLEDELLHAAEWMLRSAALTALSSRQSPSLVRLARRALEDDYPRVRAAAATVLRGDSGSLVPLAMRARRDSWPAVRAAAVTALGPDARGRRILRAALSDPSPRVRATAAELLGRLGDREAVPLLVGRLQERDEWPRVLAASAGALSEICAQEAVPALLELIDRSRRPDAGEPVRDVALSAIVALGELGGERPRDALAALAEGRDSDLRDTARRALRQPARCQGATPAR